MVTFRSLEEFDRDHGTVRLLDDSHRYKSKARSDIVLVPQPTDDPNDPLNWPSYKKIAAMLAVSMMAIMPSWVIAGGAVGIPQVMEAFGSDLSEVVDTLVTWPSLLLGIGVFVWVPSALYFGVRPISLVASILVFSTCFWSAGSHSAGSLEASRIVCAFAMSCAEVLPAVVVKDIFFLHERGFWMGIYLLFTLSFPGIGNICSGLLITHVNWRWHFWVTGIVGVIFFGFLFFFLPETQYNRPAKAQAPSAQSRSASEDEITPPNQKDSTSVEEIQPVDLPVRKPYLQQLNPWSGINPGGNTVNFFIIVARSWPLVLYPAVIYSTVIFGLGVAALLAFLDTAAPVFQAPPYNMSAFIQSLISVPFMIGGAFGCFIGGLGSDLFCRYRARKNNGVFEPENRLLVVILPAFLAASGILMYGWGIAEQKPWELSWIGGALIPFGHGAIPTITIAYAVDCYYPVAPEAIQLIVGLRQVIGFGFSYAVTPWLASWGYERVYGTMAGLYLGAALFAIPLYFYGKQLRYASAKWKILIW